jgi:hypothetical protein
LIPYLSTDSDKENADPDIMMKMETEQEECVDIVNSGQKRCQEEDSDSETIDTRPAKRQPILSYRNLMMCSIQ